MVDKKLIVVALILLPLILLGQETSKMDTVKVIDNPHRVVIMEDENEVLMNVKGSKADDNYSFDYRVTPRSRWRINTMQREGNEVEFRHPFKKCDTINYRPHFQLFMSGLYFGFGSNTIDGVSRDAFSKTVSEIGILNLIGFGYVFNHNRTTLSLGMGFNWTHYHLNKPYFFNRSNEGVLGFESLAGDFDNHYSSLTVRSMQFPLMFCQSLGKRWDIAAGAILNWNCYADFSNSYSKDKSRYNVTTRGLYQRKVSFDYLGMVTWHGIGAYFRYSPQPVFQAKYGPEMKNRWTIGLVLGGL